MIKPLLFALAFIGANAMACSDAAKSAAAPSTDNKPVAAVVKAKPAMATTSTARASTRAATTKVAIKPSTDARKAATL